MIPSEKGLIIKAMDNIQDPELQIEYLLKLKDIITQEEKRKNFGKEDFYSINKIYERYGKKKEPTIQELHPIIERGPTMPIKR